MICRLVSGIPGPKSLSQVAAECGENLTEAIIHALEERLARLIVRGTTTDVAEEIMKISLRCKALPDMDRRSADEILDYDDDGLPQ